LALDIGIGVLGQEAKGGRSDDSRVDQTKEDKPSDGSWGGVGEASGDGLAHVVHDVLQTDREVRLGLEDALG